MHDASAHPETPRLGGNLQMTSARGSITSGPTMEQDCSVHLAGVADKVAISSSFAFDVGEGPATLKLLLGRV
jgi:hypothetical protein